MIDINDLNLRDRPAQLAVWAKVFDQAKGHIRRLDHDAKLEQRRPSESKENYDYRIGNRRMITREGVGRFHSKAGRIFEGYGINFSGDISKPLQDWLSEEKFYYLNQYAGLKEYTYRVIFPAGTEDPNALLMVWPEHKYDRSLPAIENPANEAVNITTYIIQCTEIVHVSEDLLVWEYGFKRVVRKDYPILRSSTKNEFYIHEPYYDESDKKVKYTTELWYIHDFGYLPINILQGVLTKSDEGFYYNESFLQPYFEYGDEFKGRFSDDQVVSVSSAHPKVIMSEMPCTAEGCRSGNIIHKEKDGTVTKTPCSNCKGKGIIQDPGPLGVLIRPRPTTETASAQPEPFVYVNPDTAVLQISYDTAFDLLERAKKSIGLDILMDLNESGVAKDARLEDLQDLLVNIAGSLFDTLEMFLFMIEGLLVPEPSRRIKVKIKRPQNFKLKDNTALLNDYEKALPSDRFSAAMDFYENKYKGQEEVIRAHKLAMKYAPLLLVPASELPSLIGSGVYGSEDVKKRDRAEEIFLQLAEEANFIKISDADLFKKADEILGIRSAIMAPLVGEDGLETPIDIEAEAKARLKGTVGGVQGIIAINTAVSQGTMTRASGVTMLMEIYGYSLEVANKMIETPPIEKRAKEAEATKGIE